ncbi:MAG: ribose 5-phosphate isomerase B [Acidobacteria bacterium]|nr:ribose 5-phosphate isomerase B [Acidobacteriota bacterium]MCI0719871.1 ribose 5-phosphate isomerase B [Acidobacteriota bacterium]
MRIAVGADHAGYPLKVDVVRFLEQQGYEVVDLGTHGADPVDYPDYAKQVGQAVRDGQAYRGILVCGSGVGACVAANKMRGIRAALCHDTYTAHQGVEHDDINVLCLGGRVVGPALACDILRSWLTARYIGAGRHKRRVEKILEIERAEMARTDAGIL